jgi:crotonobetainyl-CoA hydratase
MEIEMSDFLNITRNGQVLEIVLDRPKANTIDAALSREMSRVYADFRDDPDLRVAIFSGAGEKFFSAGWDLGAVAEGEEYLEDFGEGGFGGFPEMTNLLKPVICAVNGLAVGAGFEMLFRADFVLAAEHAEFLLPEVRIGMAPDVGTFMLPKLLPRQKALEILMCGRRQSANDLAALGLINEVVPADQLMERARAFADDLLKAAPLSLAAIKEAVQLTETLSFEESYAALRSRSWPAFMKMLDSSDSREGAQAFLEKRPPVWKGK